MDKMRPFVVRPASADFLTIRLYKMAVLGGDVDILLQSPCARHGVVHTTEHETNHYESNVMKVTNLNNVTPICSHCKSIRSKEGHWIDIEEHFTQEYDVVFSHGICLECFKEHYSWLGIENQDQIITWASRNQRVKVLSNYSTQLTIVRAEFGAEMLDFFLAIDHMFRSKPTADVIWDFTGLAGISSQYVRRDIRYLFSRIVTNYAKESTNRRRVFLVYNQNAETVGQALREVVSVAGMKIPRIDFELFTDIDAAMTCYRESTPSR